MNIFNLTYDTTIIFADYFNWAIHIEPFYRPQRSCGQGNVFTGVCLSTGGEGVCLSACWDARPPPRDQADTPRTRQTPPDQADPPGPGRPPSRTRQTPPGPGRPPRTRQTPPDQVDTPRDQADTPRPPGKQTPAYERPVRMLLQCILVHQIKSLLHC